MTGQHGEVIIRMKHEVVALPWITLQELARRCECRLTVVRRLVDIGLLEPEGRGGEPLFDAAAVIRVRKALRLKRDLELNFNAVALVMELLDRIDHLERC